MCSPWCPIWAATPLPTTQSGGGDDGGDYDTAVNSGDAGFGGDDVIQNEIESYIITDGLGKHLSDFISKYTSNIKETGVWLSGFYGSGKS